MSYLVNRPEVEPGFGLAREEGPGRQVHYRISSYATDKPEGEDEEDEDFDDGGGMSISALEAELRDGVMEVLDAIAADFGGFRKLQDKLVEARLKGEVLSAKDQKTYDALTADISGRLKTMKLNWQATSYSDARTRVKVSWTDGRLRRAAAQCCCL